MGLALLAPSVFPSAAFAAGDQEEWLKVKPGMEKAAAFLESRRFGAIMGATSEFNKMEGVTINEKDNKVYVAMSYVEKSMEIGRQRKRAGRPYPSEESEVGICI